MISIRMTRPQFTAALQKVVAVTGQPITTDTGCFSHARVTVGYSYDGTLLTIEVQDKPFFLTDSEIETKILAWFGSQPTS